MTFFRPLLIVLLFFLCIPWVGETKPPNLEPKDVKTKLEEILKAHATQKELTCEIMKRSLHNYLEILDPAKTYLTQEDINQWINPSDESLKNLLADYKKNQFSLFEKIYGKMCASIERRSQLEEEISELPLPTDLQPNEFKDIEWTANVEALRTRLLRLRATQVEIAKKLNEAEFEQTLQLMNKRRLNREEKIASASTTEKQKMVLAYVLKATASALDSQTAYFTPDEAQDFMIQLQQRLFGIGVLLRDNLNGFTIVRIIEGGPASVQNKIRPNDRLIAVNGTPVIGMDIQDVVDMIRGEAGTNVNLTLLRPVSKDNQKNEEKIELPITRGEVVLKETRFETSYEPFGDGIIAHITLFSFYQDQRYSSASDVRDEIQKLKQEHNLKGVILDLRQNVGGLLPQAIAVTGLFIKKGIVASIKDSDGRYQHLRNTENSVEWDGPLIVLTSRASASAAEIVAQALQDYGRAIIVGDPSTFGKGTFQTSTMDAVNGKRVNPKGEYKVTRGTYYTVSGKSPQLKGVLADIVVPGQYSEMEIGERYGKWPLDNAQIEPHFEDDLSDVPSYQRSQVKKAYLFNLQERVTTYNRLLPLLRKNAEERIAANKGYQRFLQSLRQTDESAEEEPPAPLNDLQLDESFLIMKDLIYLSERQTREESTRAAA